MLWWLDLHVYSNSLVISFHLNIIPTFLQRGFEKPKPFHSHKLQKSPSFGKSSAVLKIPDRFVSAFSEWWCTLSEWNGLGFLKTRLFSSRALEYESRGRGFESYSGHFHSHRISRLIFPILHLLKFTPATLSSGGTAMVSLVWESRRPSAGPV